MLESKIYSLFYELTKDLYLDLQSYIWLHICTI